MSDHFHYKCRFSPGKRYTAADGVGQHGGWPCPLPGPHPRALAACLMVTPAQAKQSQRRSLAACRAAVERPRTSGPKDPHNASTKKWSYIAMLAGGGAAAPLCWQVGVQIVLPGVCVGGLILQQHCTQVGPPHPPSLRSRLCAGYRLHDGHDEHPAPVLRCGRPPAPLRPDLWQLRPHRAAVCAGLRRLERPHPAVQGPGAGGAPHQLHSTHAGRFSL